MPQIVQTCIQYLQQNGLSVIGLFRVAGSVKRCRQLKIDLESGGELCIRTDDEEGLEHYPHDIATLLKEFFRDLPQPLLTSELYPAFLEVTSTITAAITTAGRLESHFNKFPFSILSLCLLDLPRSSSAAITNDTFPNHFITLNSIIL